MEKLLAYKLIENHNNFVRKLAADGEIAIYVCCEARAAGIDAHVDMDTCEVVVGPAFSANFKTFEYVEEN